jgi:hypothetical protein
VLSLGLAGFAVGRAAAVIGLFQAAMGFGHACALLRINSRRWKALVYGDAPAPARGSRLFSGQRACFSMVGGFSRGSPLVRAISPVAPWAGWGREPHSALLARRVVVPATAGRRNTNPTRKARWHTASPTRPSNPCPASTSNVRRDPSALVQT